MNHAAPSLRRATSRASLVTSGTLIVAVLSALLSMTGCHSAAALGTATATATHRDSTASAAAISTDTLPPLQPFDEQFYVAPPEDDATQD